jgi:hypothetical protein
MFPPNFPVWGIQLDHATRDALTNGRSIRARLIAHL